MTEPNGLSEREIDVLHLLVTGASNKEIAQKLNISTNTVKVHLRNIYAKIEVSSRTEAVLYAVNSGLLPIESDLNSPNLDAGITEMDGEERQAIQVQGGRLSWFDFIQTRNGILFLGAGGILVALVIVIILMLTQVIGINPAPDISSPADLPRWQSLPSMSSARSGLAVATFDNAVYAIAGENEESISDIVEKYDPAKNSWQQVASKPTAVMDISAGVIGGKIYVPGGRLPNGRVANVLEIYDPRMDRWSEGAKLPRGLSAYSLEAFEGKLYLFGGWDGSELVKSVYVYDPERDTWLELPEMPTARGYAGSATVGGRIYIIGGYDGDRALSVNEVFYPSRSEDGQAAWETGTSLPQGVYAMGITSIADILYLLGGKSDAEREFNTLAFFTASAEWGAIEESEIPLGAHLGAVSIGSNIYTVGGEIDGALSSQAQVYQAIYTVSIPVIIK